MTLSTESAWRQSLFQQLEGQAPFSLLPGDQLQRLLHSCSRVRFQPGERLLRPDELNSSLYLVLKGEVRLIALGAEDEGQISLGLRGPGQLLGWASLLRAAPTEFVQASTEVVALALPAADFVELLLQHPAFANHFYTLTNLQEAYVVAAAAAELMPKRPANWRDDLVERVNKAQAVSIWAGESPSILPSLPSQWSWYLSSPELTGLPVGTPINSDLSALPQKDGYRLPYRLVAIPYGVLEPKTSIVNGSDIQSGEDQPSTQIDLYQLGILEEDKLSDDFRYPLVRGRGPLHEALAVCEMVALQQQVPFRRDAIQKVLEDQFRRDKGLSLELMAGLCELLGMTSQLAETSSEFLASVECPALLFLDGVPVVFHGISNGFAILAHPHKGIKNLPLKEIQQQLGENFRFVLPRRVAATPTSRFGWSWFTPLLSKYRTALVLVFVTSLLAQLFGLAIPLLLQQIIDKVLNQGNLSSLNVLGATMVLLALFQGVLQALRTFIFVDTTDRMDLTLGSAVIDRLLALPLSYFEKRPVGELSQRLGELNTIRGFLTGTALISVLNIIFAALYIVVMFVYSPLLGGVALSTFPLYLILVFGVAPIYKSLIRKRAVAAARTQSHLIEVSGNPNCKSSAL